MTTMNFDPETVVARAAAIRMYYAANPLRVLHLVAGYEDAKFKNDFETIQVIADDLLSRPRDQWPQQGQPRGEQFSFVNGVPQLPLLAGVKDAAGPYWNPQIVDWVWNWPGPEHAGGVIPYFKDYWLQIPGKTIHTIILSTTGSWQCFPSESQIVSAYNTVHGRLFLCRGDLGKVYLGKEYARKVTPILVLDNQDASWGRTWNSISEDHRGSYLAVLECARATGIRWVFVPCWEDSPHIDLLQCPLVKRGVNKRVRWHYELK